ncbi:MAG: MBL fold metallo-hydrolase [Verrucomicrobiae bacterium]|nr:MBL fold metallo-hydrolase [Verrucomicrobiae bacterium]
MKTVLLLLGLLAPLRSSPAFEPLLSDLFVLRDSCNVYLLRDGDRAVAIDFGSRDWTGTLGSLGIKHLDYILLTHHHRDQCEGLLGYTGNAEVRAPVGESDFLTPDGVKSYWKLRLARPSHYPRSFSVLPRGLHNVRCNLAEGSDLFWGRHRIRFLPTPGHSAGALTVMVTWHGRNVFFCGDAVHAGGKIWQPYHLEWDHWTPGGAIQAWYGLQRLGYCKIDLLCPSHGPVVRRDANNCVRQAQQRLMAFIRAKGSVCEGERDDYFPVEPLPGLNSRRLLSNLYQVGSNGYLLVSKTGEGFLVDPFKPDLPHLEALLPLAGVKRLTVATASHYHYDHCDGFPAIKDKYGTQAWLHPWVAEVLANSDKLDLPYLPAAPIRADRLLPETGEFTWNEYRFKIWPLPGQTRWHCALMTTVDGQRVFFSGDSFQAPSRWNGTGGFCAYNNSRFDAFRTSAQLVLHVKPDLIANGHQVIYRFHPRHYKKIIRWANMAENAVRDLCPSKDWTSDYYFQQKLEQP